MKLPTAFNSLKTVLLIDAGVCVGFGIAIALAASPIAGLTGIPEPFLVYVGWALVPIGLFMAASAAVRALRKIVPLIIIGNIAYIVASIPVAFGGWFDPNPLGTAFILLQAACVLPLVVLEYRAFRNPTGRATPA